MSEPKASQGDRQSETGGKNPSGHDVERMLGPRGGLTTVTPGGLNRLSTYLLPDEREAVRRRAFDDDTSISEVIRSAIRSHLGLP